MKKTLFITILFLLSYLSYGQSNIDGLKNQIDSLNRELAKSTTSEKTIDLALEIAGKYLSTNPDSIIKYAEMALEISIKEENLSGQIGALGYLGEAQLYKGNLPKTMELGLQAIELSKNLPIEKAFLGPTYYNMAELYAQIGEYKKSLIYSQKEISIEAFGSTGGAYGYYQRANAFVGMNMLDSALINLEMADKNFESRKEELFGNSYSVYPSWYNLRAKVYFQQDKFEEGLQDLYTGLKLTKQSNEPFHIANFCNDISLYFQRTDQLDSSIFYAEEGLAAAKQISYMQGIYAAGKLLAEQYEWRDAEKALFYYKLASQTQNQLYGAGNMQIMRDMIAQEEKRLQDIEVAKAELQSQLRTNIFLGSTFTLVVIAFFLFRNNRQKQKAKQKIELAFDQLKSTQTQLIQSEKMASLGELTAGIAHEIQNPLNFVNNFSDVNKELADELLEEVEKGNKQEAKAIIKDIRENEEKILHHGKRADGIVKGMLQHSRAGGGDKEPTDINALCDEYLRLSYHGLRAKDKSFNADFKTELEESIPKINVVPQDIGRVVLNLINNAFFAVSYKESVLSPPVRPAGPSKDGPGKEEQGKEFQSHASRPDDPVGRASASALDSGDYKPAVTVSTKLMSPSGGGKGEVQITIKDNGPGIPDSIKDKIFQPFFTTKATGEGTGLGLSLSYDIIKAHGGEIKVESEGNNGSEFKIFIPC